MNEMTKSSICLVSVLLLAIIAVCTDGCKQPTAVSVASTPPAVGLQPKKTESPVPKVGESRPYADLPNVKPRPAKGRTLAKKLRLGMNIDEVYKRLGKPDKSARMPIPPDPDNSGTGWWYSQGEDFYRCRDGWLMLDYDGSGKVYSWSGPGVYVSVSEPNG
jgi:hypothetical protein